MEKDQIKQFSHAFYLIHNRKVISIAGQQYGSIVIVGKRIHEDIASQRQINSFRFLLLFVLFEDLRMKSKLSE